MSASHDARERARIGVICGASAHLLWGFLPLYLKLVSNVPSLQVLAHRLAWSLVFVAIVTTLRGGWETLWSVIRDRRAMLMLCASTCVLSANWFVFIYAVNNNHTVDASLGYFTNPLLTVLLGMIFLGERMRRWQMIALALAAMGVSYYTWLHGSLPWIALTVAVTFGSYSLLRKTVRAGALEGLTVETAILFIPATLTIVIYHAQGHSYDLRTWCYLPFAGVVTAVPYLLFAAAARRLKLMTMGFLQYITPSCQFLLAIFLFHEEFEARNLVTYLFIWTALAVYSWDSYRTYRALMQHGHTPTPIGDTGAAATTES
jgi:chloramphenicol-sensitive protein RarD